MINDTEFLSQFVANNPLLSSLCNLLAGKSGQISWASLSANDWEKFLRLVKSNGLAPLIYKQLKYFSRDGFCPPQMIKDQLEQNYLNTLANNIILYEELNRLIKLFEKANIPVILLKGSDLAKSIYDDIGLRPMGDVDLLVPEDRLRQIYSLLLASGYSPENPLIRLSCLKGILCETNFISSSSLPVGFELHWTLIGGYHSIYRPDIQWFWNESKPLTVDGIKVRNLSLEANIIYLAAHLALKHTAKNAQLIWLYDLFLLISKNQGGIDWRLIINQAKSFRWSLGVGIVLNLLRTWMNIPLPENIIANLCDYSGNDGDLLYLERRASVQTGIDRAKAEFNTVDFVGKMLWAFEFAFPTSTFLRWKYDESSMRSTASLYLKHFETIGKSLVFHLRTLR